MKPISIQAIHLHPVALPLVEPLRTSFGMEPYKSAVLCEVVTDDGIIGWGESAVAPAPGYSGETMATAYHLLKHFLAPLLVGKTLASPYEARPILAFVRDNKHARAGLEMAVWDAFAKANGLRLADLFAHYLGQPSTNRAVVGTWSWRAASAQNCRTSCSCWTPTAPIGCKTATTWPN